MLCADDVDVASFQGWEAMKARGEHLQPAPEQQQQQQQQADATMAAATAVEQASAAVQQQQELWTGQATMVDPQQVDYWALQQEFYRVGVANAPDPPPKGQPDERIEYRERFEALAHVAQQQQQQAPVEQQQHEAPVDQSVQECQQAPSPEEVQQSMEAPVQQLVAEPQPVAQQ